MPQGTYSDALKRVRERRTPAAPPDTLTDLEDFASRQKATITSSTKGRHNPGSAHYDGRAVDLRTRDKSPQEIDATINEATRLGFNVRDERTRPAGQKEWSGPHLHVDADANEGEFSKALRRVRSGRQAYGPPVTREMVEASKPAPPIPANSPFNYKKPLAQTLTEDAGQRAKVEAQQEQLRRANPALGRQAITTSREVGRRNQQGFLANRAEDVARGFVEGSNRLSELGNNALEAGLSVMSPGAPMGVRARRAAGDPLLSELSPQAKADMTAQRAAAEEAEPYAAPITEGIASGVTQLPAYGLAAAGGGIPGVMALSAAQEDWSNPVRAGVRTAASGLGLGAGRLASKVAAPALSSISSPLARGGATVATEAAGGALGNVVPEALEQAAFEGKLDPRRLAISGAVGAGTSAVDTAVRGGSPEVEAMRRERPVPATPQEVAVIQAYAAQNRAAQTAPKSPQVAESKGQTGVAQPVSANPLSNALDAFDPLVAAKPGKARRATSEPIPDLPITNTPTFAQRRPVQPPSERLVQPGDAEMAQRPAYAPLDLDAQGRAITAAPKPEPVKPPTATERDRASREQQRQATAATIPDALQTINERKAIARRQEDLPTLLSEHDAEIRLLKEWQKVAAPEQSADIQRALSRSQSDRGRVNAEMKRQERAGNATTAGLVKTRDNIPPKNQRLPQPAPSEPLLGAHENAEGGIPARPDTPVSFERLAARQAERGVTPEENQGNQSLESFVIRNGGVKRSQNNRGDAAYGVGREGGRPGFINDRSGIPVDVMRQQANEAGFGPYETEADFLSAMRDARNVFSGARRNTDRLNAEEEAYLANKSEPLPSAPLADTPRSARFSDEEIARIEQMADEQSSNVLPFNRIRPPAPASRRRPARLPGPSDKSLDFPREQRALVTRGREIERMKATGTEGSGGYGRFAQQAFKSTVEGGEKGQTAFYESPNVKGAVGLDADARPAEVREAFKKTFAQMMKVNADEVSLADVPQTVWDAWMRRNGARLGREDVRRYKQTIENAQRIENTKAQNENIQAADTERSGRGASSVRADARPTGNVVPSSNSARLQRAGNVSNAQQTEETGRSRSVRESLAEQGLSDSRPARTEAVPTASPDAARSQRLKTVTHKDPAINGKPILAETQTGKVIVANPDNVSGVSVVKDQGAKAENLPLEQRANKAITDARARQMAATDDMRGLRPTEDDWMTPDEKAIVHEYRLAEGRNASQEQADARQRVNVKRAARLAGQSAAKSQPPQFNPGDRVTIGGRERVVTKHDQGSTQVWTRNPNGPEGGASAARLVDVKPLTEASKTTLGKRNREAGAVRNPFTGTEVRVFSALDDLVAKAAGQTSQKVPVPGTFTMQKFAQEVKAALVDRDLTPKQQTEAAAIVNKVAAAHAANDGAELVRQQRAMADLLTKHAWVADPFRPLLAAGEWSFIGLQGAQQIISNLGNPKALKSMGRDLLKSTTRLGFDNLVAEMRNHPRNEEALKAGLALGSQRDLKPMRSGFEREEAFHSRIADMVPGLPMTSRQMSGLLESQRLQAYDGLASMLNAQGFKYDDAALTRPERAKINKKFEMAAELANTLTGRGDFGKFLEKNPAIGSVLGFGPRWVASRFQLMNPNFYRRAYKADPQLAKQAGKEALKLYAAWGSVLAAGAVAGFDVSFDPDDSDFMKLKRGNYRLDISAGMRAQFRIIAQMVKRMSELKDKPTDEVIKKAFQNVGHYGRTKLSPLASLAPDFYFGKNMIGERVTPRSAIEDRVFPIFWQGVYDAYQEGQTGKALRQLPNAIGLQGSEYERKAKRPAARSSAPRLPGAIPLPTPVRAARPKL